MSRYLPETREVSVGADKSSSKLKITINVRNKVPESRQDFVDSFCGGSEERELEYLISHVISDENVDARALLRAAELNEGETQKDFYTRMQAEGQAEVDGWTAEKTRRIGTGATSKAKAVDEITAMLLAGKSADDPEVQEKVAALAQRFGVAQPK